MTLDGGAGEVWLLVLEFLSVAMGIECTVLLLAVGNMMAPSHAEDLQLEQQGHSSLGDPPVHLTTATVMGEANMMMILYGRGQMMDGG